MGSRSDASSCPAEAPSVQPTPVRPLVHRAPLPARCASFGGTEGDDHARPRARRDAQLALLRDCAKIAEWDALATAKAVVLDPDSGGPTRDDDDPDEIDRVQRRRVRLADGAAFRSRLTALWTRGRAETARLEAAWLARPRSSRLDVDLALQTAAHGRADLRRATDQRWLDVLRVLAQCVCMTASCLVPVGWRTRHRLARPIRACIARPWIPPVHTVDLDVGPQASDAERAAAVLEWLVPRARVMLDSVNDRRAISIERSLTAAVAQAFSSPTQWARWHPAPPSTRASRDVRQAYLVAAQGGVAGIRRHGERLLALAESAWFGTGG